MKRFNCMINGIFICKKSLLILLIFAILFTSAYSTTISNEPTDTPIKISKSFWPGQFWKDIADSKGWFAEAGLNVELVDTNQDYYGSLQDMVDGKMDANGFPAFDFINYISQGSDDLVAIIYTDVSWGIDGIVAKSSIESISELKGRKVGFAKNTYSDYMLSIVLGNEGLSQDDIITVEVLAEDIGPFVNGDIDAFISWQPFIDEAAEKGNGHIIFDTSTIPGLNSGVEVFHKSFIENRPEDVQAYVNVWYKTTNYIHSNPDDAFGIIAKIYDTSLSEVVELTQSDKIVGLDDNKIALSFASGLGSLHGSLSSMNNFLIKKKLTKQKVDTTLHIDPIFIRNVHLTKTAQTDIETQASFAESKIEDKARDVANQINNYLISHPEKTLEDLKKDEYFNSIAIQQVGKTGYTLIGDYENLFILFHKDSRFVDFDMRNFEKLNPAMWEFSKSVQLGNDAFGFHPFVEEDGSIRDKFSYMSITQAETADGIKLFVAATTYLDEYERITSEEAKNPISLIYLAIASAIILIVILVILNKLNIIKFEKNIIMLLMGFFLLLIIGLSVFNTYQQTQTLKNEKISSIKSALESVTASRANHINTFLQNNKEILKIMALSSFTKDALSLDYNNPEYSENLHRVWELQERIEEVASNNDKILKITYIDRTGRVVVSSDKSSVDSVKEEVIAFLKNDGVYIKKEHWSKDFQVPAIDYGIPITDINNKIIGGVIIDLDLSQLFEITANSQGMGETGKIHLVNNEKIMITPSRFKNITFLQQKVDTENARSCFADYKEYGSENGVEEHKEEIIISEDYMGINVFGTHTYIPEMKWCLLAEIDEDEIINSLNKNIRNMWLFAFGLISSLVIIAIIFNFLLTKTLRKEINTKTEELQKFNKQLEETVKERTEELQKLNQELEIEVEKRTNILNSKVKELEDTKVATLNILEDVDETNRELVKAQKQLDEKIEQLKILDKTKDEFLSVTAHELKTPLTSIRGFVELLKNDAIMNNKESREKYFNIIIQDTRRLAQLITDILDLSRMDIGTLKFNYEKVKLSRLFKELEDSYSSVEKSPDVKLEFHLEKDAEMNTDKARLIQVISNLINNAIHYTEKGKVDVYAYLAKNFINFKVTDTGKGIPQEELSKIFGRFYQVDSSYTRKIGGSGLGLAISKGIVEALGGLITVASEVEKGTQFEFSIPLKIGSTIKEERLQIFEGIKKSSSKEITFEESTTILIEKLEKIMGPMAIEVVKNTKGIKILPDGKIEFENNPKEALTKLVSSYENFLGPLGKVLSDDIIKKEGKGKKNAN